ncbi:MAG: LTA synthase family protein, partial [Agathobacter sp.]|nr:LTA synthase family protein [Agathobacter sp.]
MKKILGVLKEKFQFFKEKFFTKHEREHSEKYYKVINILNSYSFIWHALLSMFVVFLVELASRWSIISAFSFIAKSPWAFVYNSFIVFASLTLVYLFKRRAFAR